jgi:diguanylate cyclase (GGDEF)-like protein
MERPLARQDAEGGPGETGEVAFRLASVRVGMAFTVLVALGSEAYAAATWDQPHRLALTMLAAAALCSVPVLSVMPLERIVRSGWREPFFYLYSLFTFGVITGATAVDGGTESPFRVLYVLPLIFAASSYPLRNAIAAGVTGLTAFGVVAAVSGGTGEAAFVGFVLVCAVALGAWQSRNRARQSARLEHATRELRRTQALTRTREAQQRDIAVLGQRALAGMPVHRLMQDAVEAVQRVLGVAMVGVLELIPERSELAIRASVGMPDEVREATVPAGTGSQSGYTLVSDVPVIVEDWSREERFARPAMLERAGTVCGVTVLIKASGRPFGVLGVQSTEERTFGPDDINFLQAMANVLANAIERRNEEEEARHRALHDPLTGLPNRLLFEDYLGRALARQERRDSSVAVIFMDLDHFKLVNDSLGHQAGDELLMEVAARLKETLRPGDVVARFGGDEFGVMIEEVQDERQATQLAERIAAAFSRPFVLAGREHFVTASIGIAIGVASDAPPELIRDADAAMYRAKERGRARYEIFDEAMRLRVAERLQIENELRTALERRQLRLVYQPVVALSSGTVTGAEALIRWEHPRHGMLYHRDFISIAEEEAGLIVAIGRWALEEACRHAAEWQRASPDVAPPSVAVNVAAAQLADSTLPNTVSRMVEGFGLQPVSLSLELTEALFMDDADAAVDVIRALKDIGVRLVLDDFGTGYSSLGYLKSLPFDAIKIDETFVARLGDGDVDDAIVSAVVALAQILDLTVVAEGVETAEQFAVVKALGCHYAQGKHLSSPLPPREFGELLRAGTKLLV